MTSFDPKKNFAVSTVQTAPTPALTGTSLQVALGEGSLFPGAGAGVAFNAIVFPANAAPTVANAEIVRVTNRVGETFTMLRTQEGTAARAIQVGDRIMEGPTVKTFTDIEAALATAAGAIVLAAQPILEPGVVGQVSRGRVLTLPDFTTLLGLTAPVAGWNLSDLTDFSGNGRALTNKGAVTFGPGIMGAATEAAIFTGSTGQALYIADAGAGDPFRIPYGSVGCWFRTAKQGTIQVLVSKDNNVAASAVFNLRILAGNTLQAIAYTGAGTQNVVGGATPITDDRWHWGVFTYDGAALLLYVDGALDGQAVSVGGPMISGASPLNIGAQTADGGAAAITPMFGRIDEAFVTQDVLSLDQVRMLYAAKVAHGFGAVPIGAKVSVRRLRKGAPLAVGVFSTPPLHLYNFTAGALTDAGSLGNALTNNGAAVVAPAPDGVQGNAFNFVAASSQSLSATDAGLPTSGAVTIGCWLRGVGSNYLVSYGTVTTERSLGVTSGNIFMADGSTSPTGPGVADGQPHFAVAVFDPAAADGLKQKLYADGKFVVGGTTLVNAVLAGANAFRIGARCNGTSFYSGMIDAPFVLGYAASADEIAKWYAQGDFSLGVSPKNAGDHVEASDATSVYLIADTLDSQNLIDLEVTA